ncbi:MAG: D-alanyl-D-alanine carboxypeptidase family protein [Solirubrobacterales bacterium]|nr:D-alanyl-D-alanine carboxypeptidase family protein [Solirubrobacterales bacterium]
MSEHLLIGSIGSERGADRVAAAQLAAVAGEGAGVILETGRERTRAASLLAPREAKDLEAELAVELPQLEPKARGNVVYLATDASDALVEVVTRLRNHLEGRPSVVVAVASRYRELLELGWDRVLIISDEPGIERGSDPANDSEEPDRVAPGPLTEAVLGEAADFADRVELAGKPAGKGRPVGTGLLRGRLRSSRGQATPLVLGGVLALVLATVAVVAISGAVTGKARAQRTADLSAMSAIRSMKDDLPRLLAPPRLPNGLPNPAHMPKSVYLSRARLAAVRAAVTNGASPLAVSVRFPDSYSYAPVRARVSIATSVRPGTGGGSHRAPPNWAEARIGIPVSMGSVPSMASGGGYSGPLAERQGHGMRPDVAAAFDAMSTAAAATGVSLTINSAFRSDAEQAALFAANPDPTWVAPPGQSLHRCATELDLGASDSYSWLVANAGRFGFVQRYSWEAWHYGFVAGPAPCSDAGNSVGMNGGDRSAALSQSMPSVTPSWVKPLILRAAMKWNVSAALLAAQLFAESSFDPDAGNGIAFGIAAFTPAAAAEYGLEDPFDPAAAIMAQAHLMSDLLEQFGSPALALAAYNAGPGAVGSCNCIPSYPETQAYVAKILGMLGGMGAISPVGMSIELVK